MIMMLGLRNKHYYWGRSEDERDGVNAWPKSDEMVAGMIDYTLFLDCDHTERDVTFTRMSGAP